MKITICLAKSGGSCMPDYWHPIDAELLFDFAPEYADIATFAVHRENHYWGVTCIENGMRVAGGNSRKYAIQNSLERISRSDPRGVRKALLTSPIHG